MIGWIIILIVAMLVSFLLSIGSAQNGSNDTSGCFMLVAIGCFIAIGVLCAVLAWRYLP